MEAVEPEVFKFAGRVWIGALLVLVQSILERSLKREEIGMINGAFKICPDGFLKQRSSAVDGRIGR